MISKIHNWSHKFVVVNLTTAFFGSILICLGILIVSCGEKEKEKSGNEISGLITFTSSGVTFLDCTTDKRYRLIDVDQAINTAMGERVVQLDYPLFATIDGNRRPHEGTLEFEQRFEEVIEVHKVYELSEEYSSNCERHIHPIITFSNPQDRWSVTFNYYVPAVIVAKPVFGRLLYFTLQDDEFPDLSKPLIELSLSAQKTEVDLSIQPMECLTTKGDGESNTFTHTLELNFEGGQYFACGGDEVAPMN